MKLILGVLHVHSVWDNFGSMAQCTDHVGVYLGNQIQQDCAKGTVTVDREHYVLVCLKTIGLTRCNGYGQAHHISSDSDYPRSARNCQFH
jgi:hypothetical protein